MGSSDHLFNVNRDDSHLQGLAEKLALNEEQQKEMTTLIHTQLNAAIKGKNEITSDTQREIGNNILASMQQLLAQFNGDK